MPSGTGADSSSHFERPVSLSLSLLLSLSLSLSLPLPLLPLSLSLSLSLLLLLLLLLAALLAAPGRLLGILGGSWQLLGSSWRLLGAPGQLLAAPGLLPAAPWLLLGCSWAAPGLEVPKQRFATVCNGFGRLATEKLGGPSETRIKTSKELPRKSSLERRFLRMLFRSPLAQTRCNVQARWRI